METTPEHIDELKSRMLEICRQTAGEDDNPLVILVPPTDGPEMRLSYFAQPTNGAERLTLVLRDGVQPDTQYTASNRRSGINSNQKAIASAEWLRGFLADNDQEVSDVSAVRQVLRYVQAACHHKRFMTAQG